MLLCALLMTGCTAGFVTPGGGAVDLREAVGFELDGADYDIAKQLEKRPAAQFPATLALLRLQDKRYHSRNTNSWRSGNYSVVTMRDVEDEEDLSRLGSMQGVRAVAPLNRLVLGELNSEHDMREAAARVHADALVLYTLETQFDMDTVIPVVGLATLGVFPDEAAKVTCTASAAIIDTRTGYLYAMAESTHDTEQLANGWTRTDALEQSIRRAERTALSGLIDEIETVWGGVVEVHAPLGGEISPAGWLLEEGDR